MTIPSCEWCNGECTPINECNSVQPHGPSPGTRFQSHQKRKPPVPGPGPVPGPPNDNTRVQSRFVPSTNRDGCECFDMEWYQSEGHLIDLFPNSGQGAPGTCVMTHVAPCSLSAHSWSNGGVCCANYMFWPHMPNMPDEGQWCPEYPVWYDWMGESCAPPPPPGPDPNVHPLRKNMKPPSVRSGGGNNRLLPSVKRSSNRGIQKPPVPGGGPVPGPPHVPNLMSGGAPDGGMVDPNAPKRLTPEQMAMGQFGPQVRGCNCRWSPWWGNWYCTGSNCNNPGAQCWNNHAVCSERPPDPKDKHPKHGHY